MINEGATGITRVFYKKNAREETYVSGQVAGKPPPPLPAALKMRDVGAPSIT